MTSVSTDRRLGVNSGAALKVPCRAASTGNLTLSGEQTIDGIACVTGDRVLVKNQTSGSQNGIYIVDTGTWGRAPDWDGAYDVVTGTAVYITSGSSNSGTYWAVTTTGTITIGTTSVAFTNAVISSAAAIAFVQSGTGASTTDVQTQLRKAVYASDYGSKMTTTPGADINAAITYLNGVGGGTVFVDRGSFTVETSILLLSNVTLEGAGWAATTLTAKAALNAPVMKNSDTSSGNTAVFVRHLKIDGNASNQSSGDKSGIVYQKVTYSGIDNVWVTNVVDWGFGIYQGDYIALKDCTASAIVGINDANGVRAGYLFGTDTGPKLANNITVENCVCRDGTAPYVDGFVLQQGTDIIVSGCFVKSCSYTGFKLSGMHNATFIGNQADGCLVGFQKQSYANNAFYQGNLAYQNSGAGFAFNQIDTGNIARGLMIHGNQAVNNGQNAHSALYGASSNRYGFDFTGTAGATQDAVSIKDNMAIDTGGATQTRGISFGANGTYSNVFMGGNYCKGNTVDLFAFPTTIGSGSDSLQWSTFTNFGNVGFTSGSYTASHPMSVQRFNFWIDNLAAAAGTTNLSDGFSGRGYVVPRAGFLRSLGVKSNAAITAGSATFRVAVNGVAVAALDTVLDSTHTRGAGRGDRRREGNQGGLR
jgi:hypothetical protein